MATSGTREFSPKFADILGNAFSNCGIRPENVHQEHIEQAILSANLVTIEFGNRGVQSYQLVEFNDIETESGVATYSLPAGTRDVWHAVLRRDNADTPIWPIARSDYHSIPRKDTTGRPFNFAVNIETLGDEAREITLWPVPDRADSLRLWLWVHTETAIAMNESLAVGRAWYDAYGWAISHRMAFKYAPDRLDALKAEKEQSFMLAENATRERRDLRLRARGGVRKGRVV